MAVVVCPRCSCPTAPGRFCEHCGERLPVQSPKSQVPSPKAEVPSPKSEVPSSCRSADGPSATGGAGAAAPDRQADNSKAAAFAEIPALPETPPLGTPGIPPLPSLPSLPPLPSRSSFGSPAAPSAEAPLAMEIGVPRRLVEGMMAVLLFRIRPAHPDWESFVLSVEGLGPEPAVMRQRCGAVFSGRELPLNVRPSEAGCVAASVRVEIVRTGAFEPEVWTAPLVFVVEASSTKASPFTINIHNEGDLAEISLGTLAERLSGGGAENGSHALGGLHEFQPVADLRLETSPTRLTLRIGERRLHLIARAPAWFGRQAERPEKGRVNDNAAALRILAPDGRSVDADASRYISRTCFLIERDGARCRLRDGIPARDASGNILPGGPSGPSGCGVVLDGERLPPFGAVSLAPGEEHSVVVAPDSPGGGLVLRLRAQPSVDIPQTCSGALLRRADDLPESYLVLWGEADLGAIEPTLAGWRVRREGAAFLLRPPSGALVPLVSGTVFGPTPASAETFQQLLL